MKFVIFILRQMESDQQEMPFLEIAKESQTCYTVNDDMQSFSFVTFIPSFKSLGMKSF